MPTEPDKRQCVECGWIGHFTDLLVADNPFGSEQPVTGCPRCKSVQYTREICDEPGCEAEAVCGTPTVKGYRRTCGKHQPRKPPESLA